MNKQMKRTRRISRVFLLALCLIMACWSFGALPDTASAKVTPMNPDYAEYGYSGDMKVMEGKEVAKSKLVASKIDYIQAKYKWDKKYPGSGMCYGYAVKINSMFGNSNKRVTLNKKLTVKNMRKYLKKAKPGTHLRLKGGFGTHSIVIFKVTDKMIYWSDNNSMSAGQNKVHHYAEPLKYFYHLGTFKKMDYMEVPRSIKAAKKPDAACMTLSDGYTHIYWMKTASTKSYKVYRKSGSGSFKCIKSGLKSMSYVDKSAVPGRTYTYKIKAVKKSGKKVSGETCKAKAKLATPVVKVKNNDEGKIVVSWKKIKGAKKYKIYYYDYNDYEFKLLKTIKSGSITSFIDTKIAADDYTTKRQYVVRAVGTYNGKTIYSYRSMDSDYITQDYIEPVVPDDPDQTADNENQGLNTSPADSAEDTDGTVPEEMTDSVDSVVIEEQTVNEE